MKISALIFFTAFILCACSSEPEEKKPNTKRKGSISDVRSGDLVVKRGRGHLSNTIVRALREEVPLSHCGIVSISDSVYIIHSVARELTGIDGVQKISYDRFIKDCIPGYFYIVRYKGDAGLNDSIHATTERYLARHTPFDYEINYTDNSRVNCSELLFQVLKETTKKDLFGRRPVKDKEILAFNSLLDTNNFEVIFSF